MREILFRGKYVCDGNWIYGYYIGPAGLDASHEICDVSDDGAGARLDVDPETIGQYTGLTDKNGTKIFEGDILNLWVDDDNEYDPIKKYRAVVEFGNPNAEYNWGFQLKMIDRMSFNEDILLWVEMEDTGAFCEVIGNIHDNPELVRQV